MTMKKLLCWLGGHAWVLVVTLNTRSGTVLRRFDCERCVARRVLRYPAHVELTPPRQVRPEYLKQVRR
jgi:hypothetical protein